MKTDVSVIIPTIPPRAEMLRRAIASVEAQTIPVSEIIVETDLNHWGAGPTRERGMRKASCTWSAFLDDDDYWDENHLERALFHAEEQDADVLVPYFRVGGGGTDPFPHSRGRQVNWESPETVHIFPICVVYKTEFALRTPQGIFPDPGEIDRGWPHQDLPLWWHIHEQGAKFFHYPEETWTWVHHSSNSSGLGCRW